MANRDLARFENARHKITTNSAMGDLGICEGLWYWKNVEMIEPARGGSVPRGLYFGSAMHKYLDLRIAAETGQTNLIAMNASLTALDFARQRFDAEFGPFSFETVEQLDTIDEDLTEVMGAYERWEKSEVGEQHRFSRWMSTEVVPELPWMARWKGSSSVTLAGVVDGLGLGHSGRPVLAEHKTTGDKNLRSYMAKLKTDTQILTYAWAVKVLTGEMPEGVVYTVIHNKPPKRLRFKKNDHLYANKNGDPGTDRYSFERQILEKGRSMDDLEDYEREQYEAAKNRDWVIREFWPIDAADVERWRVEAQAKITRMKTIRRHPHLMVLNRNACRNMWGRECPYIDKCSGKWIADDAFQTRKLAPEVAGALLDQPLLKKALKYERRSNPTVDGPSRSREAGASQTSLAAPNQGAEGEGGVRELVDEGDW